MPGPYVVYRKETGERVVFNWSVDQREALATGQYVLEKPENAPKKQESPLTGEELKKSYVLSEKARLGSPLTEEERVQFADYQARDLRYDESDDRAKLGGTPQAVEAPESQEAPDDFNPATADRAALFDYLRKHGEEVPNATGTTELRDRVTKKIGAKKKGD